MKYKNYKLICNQFFLLKKFIKCIFTVQKREHMSQTSTPTQIQPTYEPATTLTSKADWTSSVIKTAQQTSPAPQMTDENEDMLDYLYLLFLLFLPGGGGVGYIVKRCIARRRRRRNVQQVTERERNDIGELAMEVAEDVIEMCEVQGQGGTAGSEVDSTEKEIDTSVLGASGGTDPAHTADSVTVEREVDCDITSKKELTVNVDNSGQAEKIGVTDEELGRLMRSKLASSSVGKSKPVAGARPKTFVIKK